VSGPRRHGGDGGETGLGGGQRVRKDDPRIECVGSVDELSSFLGLAVAELAGDVRAGSLVASLRRIQRELHTLGAELACRESASRVALDPEHVAALDREVEDLDRGLPQLRGFILPGGGRAAANLHAARAVCRRAERQVVRLAATEPVGASVLPYLNRLSLLLFSMARQAARLTGAGDELV
jgi:cob(I)alamin adenosyltransferase